MRRPRLQRARLILSPWAAATATVFVLVACVSDEAEVGERGPHDPDATMDTDQIVVEPTVTQPGDTLEVRFPEEMSRGVHLVLERESDGDWHHAYNIATDVHHDGAPRVYEAGDDDFGIDDLDIQGPGPDPVPVPDDAPTGDYRVCTGNAADNVCTPVTLR